ncbi:MAG TPA: sigma-54 dependent transcriptional regulator [Longimicrobium sp.]
MREPSRPIVPFRSAGSAAATARVLSAPAAAPREAADGAFLGRSPRVLAALEVARLVADSTATVLVQGESGTGKELLARIVHEHSRRARGPFVAVNCAAIPETLLESELFGHERGAFTGAASRRLGRFERASGGTLFLDEVGDMSPTMQAKILRVLQEHEIERVGGDTPVRVDVRVVAATNRDLEAEAAAGRFREDLYYRLAVVVVQLPALRDRGDDVDLLARRFLETFAAEHGRPVRGVSPDAAARLRAYTWPGNVRQLRNVMERAVLMADGEVLRAEHLAPEVLAATAAPEPDGDGRFLPLRELERRHIRRALDLSGGNLGDTARMLGIHRNTLRQKLRQLDGRKPGDSAV